jgi:hypothetical protein
MHSTVGGGGGEGCFLCSPEDLLNKNMSCAYIHYHQKHIENDICIANRRNKKVCYDICKAFLFKKK